MDNANKIVNLVSTNMNIPSSIKVKFFRELFLPTDSIYNVDIKEEKGKKRISFKVNYNQEEYNFVISLDDENKKYDINSRKIIYNFNRCECENHKKISIEYTKEGYNGQEGYIYDYVEGESYLYNNNGDLAYDDKKIEERILYDENGIEMMRKSINEYYPTREFKGKFTYDVNNARNVKARMENTTYRENLDYAINYHDEYDISNNKVDSSIQYYHLSNEHGLANMDFNLGEISKEDFDNPYVYTSEELMEAVKNDYEEIRNHLIESYSVNMQR